jgi:hypothetical protein
MFLQLLFEAAIELLRSAEFDGFAPEYSFKWGQFNPSCQILINPVRIFKFEIG